MKKPALKRPDITWLRAFTFTAYSTSVMVASYFPLFYAHLGFSSSQIGLLYALGPMISLFSNLLWSIASDRYRTIKRILILLLIGQISMTLILSVSTSFSLIMLIITLFYFFFYPVFPLSDTIAITTAKLYNQNFISIRIFGSLGYAVFAIIIGYVLSHVGTSSTMYVSIALTLTTLLFALLVRERPVTGSVAKINMSGIWPILKKKELLWFFACVFTLAIGVRMNDAFLTITLDGMGASENLIGWAMLASALSEMPMFLFLSKYGDKYKELPLLIIACIMFGVRFLLMGMIDSAYGVLFIQMMHGLTFGIFYVTAIRMLTRLIPEQYMATGMALFTMMWSSISGLLSGSFGGMVFQYFGREQFYLVAMATSLLAGIGFASRYLYRRHRSINEPQ